jgi:hypothetical protein
MQTAQGISGQVVANTPNNSSDNESDQVTISPAGKMLTALPALFSEEIEADGRITLDEMRQFFQEKSADFQKEVNLRLTSMGVDTSQPLDLNTDANGRVKVVGDHPDKDKIEAMFADDPELSNQFRQISSTGSFIKACEDYVEFAADYAQDPKAAVAKHAHMFSALKPHYMVRLDQDGISMVKET